MTTQQNEPMPQWMQNLLMVNSDLDESAQYHSDPPGSYRVQPTANYVIPAEPPPPVVRQWAERPRAPPTLNVHDNQS